MSKVRFYPPDRLENSEIRKRLISKKYPQRLVDEILQQFWFRDWENSFVSFKPYYKLLEDYLAHGKQFNRPDFYKFVFSKLAPGKSTYKEIQKLGLAFELMHTDRLLTSDFNKLASRLELDTKLIKKLLLRKSNLFEIMSPKEENRKKYYVWKHHTLTEYLASDYILRQKHPLKQAKEFMILNQKGITAFKNSFML